MTADKAALEREMNALRTDNDRLRSNTETMVAEKWELSAANAGEDIRTYFRFNFLTFSIFFNLINRFRTSLSIVFDIFSNLKFIEIFFRKFFNLIESHFKTNLNDCINVILK